MKKLLQRVWERVAYGGGGLYQVRGQLWVKCLECYRRGDVRVLCGYGGLKDSPLPYALSGIDSSGDGQGPELRSMLCRHGHEVMYMFSVFVDSEWIAQCTTG